MPAQSIQFKFALGTGTNTATSVAIPSTSVSSDGTRNFKSQREKGDGYYSSSNGFHTVSWTITPNFVGTLTIQASLAVHPEENDWFEVLDAKKTYNQVINPILTTATGYVNFVGNFVWVRANVMRSSDDPNGSVMFINYNH